MAALDPGLRKGGVIDQADVGEPFEDLLGDVFLDALARHRRRELGRGPRAVRELAQADLPGLRRGVDRFFRLGSPALCAAPLVAPLGVAFVGKK